MLRLMASLDKVIATLLENVDAALEKNAAANPRSHFEAERVILSLDVSLLEHAAPDGSVQVSFEVASAEPLQVERKTHRLTFEFRSAPASPGEDAESPSKRQGRPNVVQPISHRLNADEEEQASKALASVFGAPGFDSSARATVFREIFAELNEPQAEALIASFSSGTIPGQDARLLTARHRINGILRSGPLRSPERGGEILAAIFSRYAGAALLVLIKGKWKTQQDW